MKHEVSKLNPTEAGGEPFIGKRQVALKLGRTERAVEQMMRRRLIPFYRFDSRAAFRWSEVQEALAQSCRVAAAPDLNRTKGEV